MRLLQLLTLAATHALNAPMLRAPLNFSVPPDIERDPAWPVFRHYVDAYDKHYTTDEFRDRYEAFRENLNGAGLNTNGGHETDLNAWADLTPPEFREAVGGKCSNFQAPSYGCNTYVPNATYLSNLPGAVDWRDHNAVTPVKNQQKCGSCWSFSATGAMEGAWALATGNLVSLSEQQLLDCSESYGNNACNGGIMAEAFQYAKDHGMCSEAEDPYEAAEGDCNGCDPVVQISNCYNVRPGNQRELKAAVARGPVSVAIEADTSIFQFYSGGVLENPDCGTNLDHGVLVVGYGEEDGKKYWLVKNSWGPNWGDSGYIKIGRSESESDPGVCGIAMQPVFPEALPPRSRVCREWADAPRH